MAIAVLGGLLVLQRGSGAAVIPLLGALALGAQRLLPALQQIYSGWANLNSWSANLAAVIELLEQPLPQQQAIAEHLALQQSLLCRAFAFAMPPSCPRCCRDWIWRSTAASASA